MNMVWILGVGCPPSPGLPKAQLHIGGCCWVLMSSRGCALPPFPHGAERWARPEGWSSRKLLLFFSLPPEHAALQAHPQPKGRADPSSRAMDGGLASTGMQPSVPVELRDLLDTRCLCSGALSLQYLQSSKDFSGTLGFYLVTEAFKCRPWDSNPVFPGFSQTNDKKCQKSKYFILFDPTALFRFVKSTSFGPTKDT